MACRFGPIAQPMKASGSMIFNTEKVKKVGRMDHFFKETTLKERNMELVTIAGTTEVNILVTGTKTKSTASEPTAG